MTIDATAPILKNVYESDGFSGGDLNIVNKSSFDLVARWYAADPESGIKGIKWAIGTYRGGTDLQGWTKTPNTGSATKSLRSLFNGKWHYVTVRAWNKAGTMTEVISNGFLVDTLPPTKGLVLDGWDPQDSAYQSVNGTIWASWKWIEDNVGLSKLEVGAGSSPAKDDLHSFKSIDLKSTKARLAGLYLATGQTVYFSVRATDRTGSQTITSSNGVVIDTTPPRCDTTVRDGKGADVDWFANAQYFLANWDHCRDSESFIQQYMLGLTDNRTLLQDNILPFKTVGRVTRAVREPATLAEGTTYYILLKAVNKAGLSTIVASDGFAIDKSPPFCTSVGDGPLGADIDWDTKPFEVAVNFNCSDPQSGLGTVEWAVSTFSGGSDVRAFQRLAINATQANDSSIVMKEGQYYFNTIKVTNALGMVALMASDGMGFDTTPPSFRYVHDGDHTLRDKNYLPNITYLQATYRAVDLTSGVKEYFVGVGSKPGSDDVLKMQSFGTQRSVDLIGNYSTEMKYYIVVEAVNSAGLKSRNVSNGVFIDTTPPTCKFVGDGLKAGINAEFQTSLSTLGVNWNCNDPESGIMRIERVRGVNKVRLGVGTNSSLLSNFRLVQGTLYKTTLIFTNKAGVSSTFTTDGVRVDLNPPHFTSMRFWYDVDGNRLRGAFEAVDNETSIEEFRWKIGSKTGGDDLLTMSSLGKLGTADSKDFPSLTVKINTQYYITVRALDAAGLKAEREVGSDYRHLTAHFQGKDPRRGHLPRRGPKQRAY